MVRELKTFSIVGVMALWVAPVCMTACLSTDEPDFQSTFTLEADDLSLKEYDRSAEGLSSAVNANYYCAQLCECVEELFDYDYELCLDEIAEEGYSEDECYEEWLDCLEYYSYGGYYYDTDGYYYSYP